MDFIVTKADEEGKTKDKAWAISVLVAASKLSYEEQIINLNQIEIAFQIFLPLCKDRTEFNTTMQGVVMSPGMLFIVYKS